MVKVCMLTLAMVQALANDDGVTIKNGFVVSYKTGYQVATYGIECHTAEEAYNACIAMNDGKCGIWFYNGIYYVDHSIRIKNKRDALKIGREHNQICVYSHKHCKCFDC